jgi:ERCC4-related helicase
VLVEHFRTHDAQTKAIVFSHYRDSVNEITARLDLHPELKVCGTVLLGRAMQPCGAGTIVMVHAWPGLAWPVQWGWAVYGLHMGAYCAPWQVAAFVGQSGGKAGKGLKQKDQLQRM